MGRRTATSSALGNEDQWEVTGVAHFYNKRPAIAQPAGAADTDRGRRTTDGDA